MIPPIMPERIFRCATCLNLSTRPRISFDSVGRCNACLWSSKKRKIDWESRKSEFFKIVSNTSKSKGGRYDCLLPVSGGKDSSYVTYKVLSETGMRPLACTVRPPLETGTGTDNLFNYIKTSGIDHLHISPNQSDLQRLDKAGFLYDGQGYYGWLTAIHTIVLDVACKYKIPLIIYGENGEVEYGGDSSLEDCFSFDVDFILSKFLSGKHSALLKHAGLDQSTQLSFDNIDKSYFPCLTITHWSNFEDWDPYRNFMIATDRFGLRQNDANSQGTFTNFAQTDQILCELHYYLMYLKFGFGRATQDAGIEIRRGALSRDQAIELVKAYDGQPPSEDSIDSILKYFQITREQYFTAINKVANPLFFNCNNSEYPSANGSIPF